METLTIDNFFSTFCYSTEKSDNNCRVEVTSSKLFLKGNSIVSYMLMEWLAEGGKHAEGCGDSQSQVREQAKESGFETHVETLLFERSRQSTFMWNMTRKGVEFKTSVGFPGGSDDKESACNAGDLGLIPGSGRSPGEGNGNPFQVVLPGKFHGQRKPSVYGMDRL